MVGRAQVAGPEIGLRRRAPTGQDPASGRLVGRAQGRARGELGIEGGCELERDGILDGSAVAITAATPASSNPAAWARVEQPLRNTSCRLRRWPRNVASPSACATGLGAGGLQE